MRGMKEFRCPQNILNWIPPQRRKRRRRRKNWKDDINMLKENRNLQDEGREKEGLYKPECEKQRD